MNKILLLLLLAFEGTTIHAQSLLSVTPNSSNLGNEQLSVMISGNNNIFSQGSNTSSIVFSGHATGYSLYGYDDSIAGSPNTLFALVDIPYAADTGLYDLYVSGFILDNAFRVNAIVPPPLNVTVSPDTLFIDFQTTMGITGQNTHFLSALGDNTEFYISPVGGGQQSFPFSISLVNDSFAVATFDVSPGSTIGNYFFVAQDYIDGTITSSNQVVVLGTQAAITTVSPDSTLVGTTLNVSISGQFTNFGVATSGWAAWIGNNNNTIYPNSINIISDTLMATNFTIPSGTPIGYYNVYASDLEAGTLEKANGFYIYNTNAISTVGNSLFDLSLYPDPARDNINVAISLENAQMVTMNISEISGKLLDSRKTLCPGNLNYILDVSGYAPGIYCIDIISDAQTLRKKFVVLH